MNCRSESRKILIFSKSCYKLWFIYSNLKIYDEKQHVYQSISFIVRAHVYDLNISLFLQDCIYTTNIIILPNLSVE